MYQKNNEVCNPLTDEKGFLFGGDWNPEQWPEETWENDLRMLEEAHINEATINVFSWALLQSRENSYNFTMLDKIVGLLIKHHFSIIMATSTAALPAWLVNQYPNILLTDVTGRRHVFGGRHNFCPNNPDFRRLSSQLAGLLSQRYGTISGLKAWHVGNEYGGGGSICYCETCARAFRTWLKKKYHSLEELNRRWGMNFWSHTITDWEQIIPPISYGDGISGDKSVISSLLIEYRRFQNDSQLACFLGEKEAIRQFDSYTPVTTNLMGSFKDLDYFSWGPQMDLVSWDNYPGADMEPSYTAMCHDLMRGVSAGKPFLLMEQTPNQQNWFPFCRVKKPGEVRALSWQAVAHGANSVQFFQLKQSLGGCERFHGAVIGHDGTNQSRTFKQIASLGDEVGRISPVISGSVNHSRVAVMFDWDNYWSLEACVGPTSGLSYPQEVHRFYKTLYRLNLSADIIPSMADLSALEKYDLILAPCLIMVKPGVSEAIEGYVSQGGTFITSYMSGIHNEDDLVIPGGYPGPLRRLTGIWAEEMEAFAPDEAVAVVSTSDKFPQSGKGKTVASLIKLETAQSLAAYGGTTFYTGTPAVTENKYGQGTAYYVGTALDDSSAYAFVKGIADRLQLPYLFSCPGIEISHRYHDKTGEDILFVINTSDHSNSISGDLIKGYKILTAGAGPDSGQQACDTGHQASGVGQYASGRSDFRYENHKQGDIHLDPFQVMILSSQK